MSACGPSVVDVITCVVHYTIDPDQIAAFEQFARAWMRHVDEHGGTHHGYYLPAEGVSDRAESCSASPAWLPTSSTAPCSAPTRTSSPLTGFETSPSASCGTSAPSCGRSYPRDTERDSGSTLGTTHNAAGQRVQMGVINFASVICLGENKNQSMILYVRFLPQIIPTESRRQPA